MTEQERQANLRNYEKLDVMIVGGQNRTRAQIERDARIMDLFVEAYKAKMKSEIPGKIKMTDKEREALWNRCAETERVRRPAEKKSTSRKTR